MADKKKYEQFRKLVRIAIGAQSQKSFAEDAGISQFHLSKLLNQDEIAKPSETTLRAIAVASNGRVSLRQLERSLNEEDGGEEKDEIVDLQAKHINDCLEVQKSLADFAGYATAYKSLEDYFDIVNMLNSSVSVKYAVDETAEYDGRGRKGAERCANVTATWFDDDAESALGFVLFYCETKGGNVIVSEVAFDLQTLLDMEHPMAGEELLRMSEKENQVIANHRSVFVTRVTNRELIKKDEAAVRLLKAIFGENYDEEYK